LSSVDIENTPLCVLHPFCDAGVYKTKRNDGS
jgi:hypothetical protein